MNLYKDLYSKEFLISNASISSVSQELQQLFTRIYEEKGLPAGRRNALLLGLEAEEALIKLLKCPDAAKNPCRVVVTRLFSRYTVYIELPGERISGFDAQEKDELDTMLEAYSLKELSRKYAYRSGANLVTFSLTIHKTSALMKSAAAILAAAVLSGLALLLPGSTAAYIGEFLVDPMLDAILGVFSMTAMTMIFFSIIMGISGMESISFVKRTGTTIMRYAFARNLIIITLSTVVFTISYGLLNRDLAVSSSVLKDLSDLIFGFIPGNIIDPFRTKNALQIMLLGAFSGIVLLLLGDRVSELKKVISQLNLFSMKAVSLVCRLTPVMIFLSVSKLILGGNIGMVLESWRLLLMQILLFTLYAAGTYIHISRKSGIPIGQLFANALPIMITGFSASSSTACLEQNLKLLKERYQVPDEKIAVIQPIFQLFFEPTKAVSLVGYSLYACMQCGQSMSVIQLAVYILVVLLLAASAPPVSGGLLTLLAILFSSLGLPAEAIILAVGVDTIVGMFRCGFKQSYYAAEIYMVSKKI